MSEHSVLDDALEPAATDDDAEDLGDGTKTKGLGWVEPDPQP
jgi:hypothetical protein